MSNKKQQYLTKRSAEGLRVLQVNLNRSKGAHDMAHATAMREHADIIVAGEPNVNLVKRGGWIVDTRVDVAVHILNSNVQMVGVESKDGRVVLRLVDCDIHCSYITPNNTVTEFQEEVDLIMQDIRRNGREALLIGDLNVKSPEWGSPVTDQRGRILSEYMSQLNMVAHNQGQLPTFVRGSSASFIDVTLSTTNIAKKVGNWEVLQGETLSDHKHIRFDIQTRHRIRPKQFKRIVRLDEVLFRSKIEAKLSSFGEQVLTVREWTELLGNARKESVVVYHRDGNGNVPYWWNSEVDEQRKKCIGLRRKLTRLNGKNPSSVEALCLRDDYKENRRRLQGLINTSKRESWRKLCDDLENDIWGDGYRIAMKQLKVTPPKWSLTPETEVNMLSALFLNAPDAWDKEVGIQNVPPFSLQEVYRAGERMKTGRSPGPDRIPTEAIKIVLEVHPEALLKTLNVLLNKQKFPREWKISRVVLLRKEGKPVDSPAGYRPICLLDTMGKLYEHLLKNRLEEEIEKGEGLSRHQYGFRRGRSTIHALEQVDKIASQAAKRVGRHRGWCTLIAIDVENAFNSATFSLIIEELRRRSIPPYLVETIGSYFTDRKVVTSQGDEMEVTAGVPQGSVLGPTLWNILYDGVLRLTLPEGAKLVGFADDLALVVSTRSRDQLMFVADCALDQISCWMRNHRLRLAPKKTEAVILSGPRKRDGIRFKLNGVSIEPSQSMKYLGVHFNEKGTFQTHVDEIVRKAEARVASLSRILPNIGGPSSSKRQLLNGVVNSTILYAAPVWGKICNLKTIRGRFDCIQRKMLLRVVSGYRTVSTPALQVIAGVPPIHLLIEERSRQHQSDSEPIVSKGAHRSITLEKWQNQWEQNNSKGEWTRLLIKDVVAWTRCKHRQTDYFLTQALSGHGSFGAYLKKIGKLEEDACVYCGQVDTADHTIFVCPRWEQYRFVTTQTLGREIAADSLVNLMLESREAWKVIHRMIRDIMSSKEKEERERQGGGRIRP